MCAGISCAIDNTDKKPRGPNLRGFIVLYHMSEFFDLSGIQIFYDRDSQ